MHHRIQTGRTGIIFFNFRIGTRRLREFEICLKLLLCIESNNKYYQLINFELAYPVVTMDPKSHGIVQSKFLPGSRKKSVSWVVHNYIHMYNTYKHKIISKLCIMLSYAHYYV